MDEFEKVEKLRQRANVSYEEAREALKEANGDLLDAIVILEKKGKVTSPEQTIYKTENENDKKYQDVSAYVSETEKKTNSNGGFSQNVRHVVGRFFRYTSGNFIQVEHKKEVVIKIPLWIAIIALLFFWKPLFVIAFISLFCGCKYSVVGENDNTEANKVMEQASEFTEQVKVNLKK